MRRFINWWSDNDHVSKPKGVKKFGCLPNGQASRRMREALSHVCMYMATRSRIPRSTYIETSLWPECDLTTYPPTSTPSHSIVSRPLAKMICLASCPCAHSMVRRDAVCILHSAVVKRPSWPKPGAFGTTEAPDSSLATPYTVRIDLNYRKACSNRMREACQDRTSPPIHRIDNLYIDPFPPTDLLDFIFLSKWENVTQGKAVAEQRINTLLLFPFDGWPTIQEK